MWSSDPRASVFFLVTYLLCCGALFCLVLFFFVFFLFGHTRMRPY